METSWEEMISASAYLEFGAQKKNWNEKCDICDHLELCAGDCLKNRTYAGNSPQNLSWLCSGLNYFFSQTQSKFDKLSEKIRDKRQKEQRIINKTRKIGRNDLCICGSGVKFKKCCGK